MKSKYSFQHHYGSFDSLGVSNMVHSRARDFSYKFRSCTEIVTMQGRNFWFESFLSFSHKTQILWEILKSRTAGIAVKRQPPIPRERHRTGKDWTKHLNYSNRISSEVCSSTFIQLACFRSGLPRTCLEISQCRPVNSLHIPKDFQLVKLVFKSLRIGYASAELSVSADRSRNWIRGCSHEPGLQLRFKSLSGNSHSSAVFCAGVGIKLDVGLIHEAYALISVLILWIFKIPTNVRSMCLM